MSTLSLLPLIKVTDGVQPDEDWQLAIAFYLGDGVTPIDLSDLSFTVAIGGIASFTSGSSQLTVTGPSNNVLAMTVFASQTTNWAIGIYPLSLTATDGVYTRELFAFSTLTVGAAQTPRVSMIVAPDPTPLSVASPVSSALAAAFQALQPTAITAAIASLSSSDLSVLTQALLGSLAIQSGSTSPVAPGQAFVNSSGYVVFAQ